MLLMFGPEYARACGIEALEPLGIYLPGDKNYPGESTQQHAGVLQGCCNAFVHLMKSGDYLLETVSLIAEHLTVCPAYWSGYTLHVLQVPVSL